VYKLLPGSKIFSSEGLTLIPFPPPQNPIPFPVLSSSTPPSKCFRNSNVLLTALSTFSCLATSPRELPPLKSLLSGQRRSWEGDNFGELCLLILRSPPLDFVKDPSRVSRVSQEAPVKFFLSFYLSFFL